jgi:flagellar biosynthetic protein FliQ
MTEQFAIDVARNAFITALEVGGPLLAASLAIGMLVSIFQAITQINEQTLSFLGPWMATTLVGYMVGIFNALPQLAR